MKRWIICSLLVSSGWLAAQDKLIEFSSTGIAPSANVTLSTTSSITIQDAGAKLATISPDGVLTIEPGITPERVILKLIEVVQSETSNFASERRAYDQQTETLLSHMKTQDEAFNKLKKDFDELTKAADKLDAIARHALALADKSYQCGVSEGIIAVAEVYLRYSYSEEVKAAVRDRRRQAKESGCSPAQYVEKRAK